MGDQVILVDGDDRETGVGDKMAVHREGALHRAFSVFVFDSQGLMLLQRRAEAKYHSGGLWSNACCSHPRPGESTLAAAHRRLQEEMGFDCPLEEAFSFTYRVRLDNDLFEHEFDHVLVGTFDGEPVPNSEEVAGWRWVDVEELERDVRENPKRYTHWFRIVLSRVVDWLRAERA